MDRTGKLCGLGGVGGRVSFIITLAPCMRAPSSWPRHQPKVPPPNNITLGIKISIYKIWGGHKHSDNGKSRAPIIHVKSSGCVSFVFYAVLFPSVLFFSHILATKILSVGTIKKDGKYYRKSLQYAWSFTSLSKMRKGIYFPLCFTNELQKLPQNDKN